MVKKTSSRWYKISLGLSGINILIVLFSVWSFFLNPSNGNGDGMALAILFLFTAAPLSFLSLLLTLLFSRTRKTIFAALLPFLIFSLSVFYDESSRMRDFDSAEYQYLVGQDFSTLDPNIAEYINGLGQDSDIPGKTSYTLRGMRMVVDDETRTIEKIITD